VEFRQARLENGLTVIGEVRGESQSVAMGFFVRTGGRDESSEVSGVSHFLEHMLFKGTERRSALEVNLEFDEMGAKYNAFTSEENTVYYAAVLPEYQEQVLALWADLMRPALRAEDFDTEKGVILEEIAMYKDQPQFDVVDRCRRLHFGEHSCGNSVLGTEASVGALTVEQMREYFARRYAADNIVLAATGKLDWEGLLGQARSLCGGWQASGAGRVLSDFSGTCKQEAVGRAQAMREHLCLMSHGPSAQQDERYAASLLANMVGDDTGSRLYWALVDTALADSAELDYEAMDGTGLFYSYVSCDPARTEEVVAVVRQTLAKVRAEGVTAAELQASKNKIASTATLHGELPMGRLVPVGSNWMYLCEYRSLTEEIAAIEAVTLEEVAAVAERYPLERFTMLGLGPREAF